jgi:hypothetical protein
MFGSGSERNSPAPGFIWFGYWDGAAYSSRQTLPCMGDTPN